jgi:hypothetical protein
LQFSVIEEQRANEMMIERESKGENGTKRKSVKKRPE